MQQEPVSSFFFFNDTATTEIYTLSLHDALPISPRPRGPAGPEGDPRDPGVHEGGRAPVQPSLRVHRPRPARGPPRGQADGDPGHPGAPPAGRRLPHPPGRDARARGNGGPEVDPRTAEGADGGPARGHPAARPSDDPPDPGESRGAVEEGRAAAGAR